MNISNEKNVMVFRRDKKYTVGIGKKNPDGSYENAYFPIQFNKDVELENKTLIKIKTAWLSFYKWENDSGKGTVFYIKCSDFDIVEEPKVESNPYEEFGNSIDLDDVGEQITIDTDELELPF